MEQLFKFLTSLTFMFLSASPQAQDYKTDLKETIKTYNSEGNLHSYNDKPSYITYEADNCPCYFWHKNGVLHRDGDKPASLTAITQKWFKNGILHRDGDKPAVIIPKRGHKWWYKNGKIHRDEDKPAIILSNGDKSWYKNGKRHRGDNKPAVIKSNGNKQFWINGIKIK